MGDGSVYLRSLNYKAQAVFVIYINGLSIGQVSYRKCGSNNPYLKKNFSPYSNPVHLKPGTHTITAILRAVEAYAYAKNFPMTLYFID